MYIFIKCEVSTEHSKFKPTGSKHYRSAFIKHQIVYGFSHFTDYEKKQTAGVIGQQSARGCYLIIFVWTFHLEHCSLSSHFIYNNRVFWGFFLGGGGRSDLAVVNQGSKLQ